MTRNREVGIVCFDEWFVFMGACFFSLVLDAKGSNFFGERYNESEK